MKVWKKSWNFGIPSIDNEHINIVKAINALGEFLGENRIRLDLQKLILALKQFTKIHFPHEESLMKELGFELYEKHCKEHEVFLEKLQLFEAEVSQESDTKVVCQKFMDYLDEWLIYHILASDRKYVDLFKEHQIQ
jgi:hemerythrin